MDNQMKNQKLAQIWERSVAFHGRPCRKLAIGARACVTALDHLGLETPERDQLVCVSESDACCIDAIQIGLGCTMGKKHLLFYRTGRMIFSVYDMKNNNSVRICTRDSVAEKLMTMQPEEILAAREEDLFYFETAHPLTEKVRNKVLQACNVGGEKIPEHFSGVQDSTERFRQFDEARF